jgi:hypothetical protein
MLDRESVLRLRQRKVEKLDVPETGDCVYVRQMTGAERDELEALMFNAETGTIHLLNVPNRRAVIASLTLCDENGQRLFTKHDVPLLGSLGYEFLDRVTTAALRVNGLNDTAVEDAEKNSEPTGIGNGGSG